MKRSWAIEGGWSAWAECWCWDVRRRSTAGALSDAHPGKYVAATSRWTGRQRPVARSEHEEGKSA